MSIPLPAPRTYDKLSSILAADNAACAARLSNASNRHVPSIVVTDSPSRSPLPVQRQRLCTRERPALPHSLTLPHPSEYMTSRPASSSSTSVPSSPMTFNIAESVLSPPRLGRASSNTFDARAASSALRGTSGYISFRDVDGLGCPSPDEEALEVPDGSLRGPSSSPSTWIPAWFWTGPGSGRQ